MNKRIGIIGGGVMGTGLVRWLLSRGFDVSVAEADSALAEKFRQNFDVLLRKDAEKDRLQPEMCKTFLKRLHVAEGLLHLEGVDLVIEAAPEDLSLKKKILSEVEGVIDPGAIISSNTSAIPITALSASLRKPERFLGTHFFNPAQVMPLVEVVPGADTSQETVDKTMTFLISQGKKPVRIKDCPGFLVNRVLGAYMNEVMWLLEEKVGIRDIETIAGELGMPMGPITLGEMVGWDIILASNETLRDYYGSRFEIPPLLKRLTREKRLGIKTGCGLMDHRSKPPSVTEDIVPGRLLDEGARTQAKKQVIAAIWAESIRCLDEGVAGAREIDEAMVLGAGFPKGPIAWADETGLDEVSELLLTLSGDLGERFFPSPILRIYGMAGYRGAKAGRGLMVNREKPCG